jgi:uncharacterized oligopeptide transporter (OPT) family protein
MRSEPAATANPDVSKRWRWLPEPGSRGYYALLAAIGLLVLGPLGGVAAAYMNFSLGFFVGGQVLAGILGSTVTFGYGARGSHGANFIQTTASSVAGMGGMAVVIQAMAWMGLPPPPWWHLVLYMLCIGMFGVGVGMLYTPILVDRLRLTFPSGLAVANILRALTDPALLRQSVAQLGGGTLLGFCGGIGAARLAWLGALGWSASTFGAGMLVGARIGIAALTGGLASWALVPVFVSAGWLMPGDPFRKITFLIALGMIMGAAAVDVSQILFRAVRRARQVAGETTLAGRGRSGMRGDHGDGGGGSHGRHGGDGSDDGDGTHEAPWQRVDYARLVAWVVFWGVAVIAVGAGLLGEPVGFLVMAVALVFVFALVNGIAVGMVDQNPISSAFVVTVILLAMIGLTDPIVGLLAASVLLVSTSVASDMQQDRSTGWRLGTDRTIQFRFQVAGVVVGALLCVLLARFFMNAYPVLRLDQTTLAADAQPARWTSAMTYKIVGSLRSLTDDKPYQRTAICLGLGIGLVTELLRKGIRSRAAYRRFVDAGRAGRVTDFVLDAMVLPSPYASSFGGFVNLPTSIWMALGGVTASVAKALPRRAGKPAALPSDMDGCSLVGGGLIAGDALAAVTLGVAGLLATVLG